MQGAYPSRGFGAGLPVTRQAWDSNLGPPASEIGSLTTGLSVQLLLVFQFEGASTNQGKFLENEQFKVWALSPPAVFFSTRVEVDPTVRGPQAARAV